MKYDLIIVGGGIIGLLSAYEFAVAGLKIAIFDKGDFGKESSWAGAGICYPLAPWDYATSLMELTLSSENYYTSLAKKLALEPNESIGLIKSGAFFFTNTAKKIIENWQSKYGIISGELLSKSAQDCLVPQVINYYQQCYYDAGITQVRNPWLLKMLSKQLENNENVDLYSRHEVDSLEYSKDKIIGVRVARKVFKSGKLLIAAGAWSKSVLPEDIKGKYKVEPVQGQIIAVQTQGEVLNSILITDDIYLVPRADGLLLIGSTIEHQGFKKTTTHKVRDDLYLKACSILPKLKNFSIKYHWSGLRPGAKNVYIEEVEFYKGLFIATGHYRCGITTAPATVKKLQQIIK